MAMRLKEYQDVLMASRVDGTTITSTTPASCIPAGAKVLFDPGYFGILGKGIKIEASGRISCAVTTPGTARFDVRFTSPVPTTVNVFDGLAVPLNVVAKSNVHWWLELILLCSEVGGTAKLFPHACKFCSEAVVGSPLPSAGGSGLINLPYNTAPVVGASFDGSVAQTMDLFFTQTVGTGSLTLHNFLVTALN